MPRNKWMTLKPNLSDAALLNAFNEYGASLEVISKEFPTAEYYNKLERQKGEFLSLHEVVKSIDRAAATAAICTLTDLVKQGWSVRLHNNAVQIASPTPLHDYLEEKQRVRAQLQVERDQQLREPSVRTFVRSMERKKVYDNRWVSIFSLMRDGRELGGKLRGIARRITGSIRLGELQDIIDPYLEFVSAGEKCHWTGYELTAIWRYFRHTWATPYRSVPGRTMAILIRDKAVEPHPVIGIAALSSSAVQISVRDKWIGWSPKEFIDRLNSDPSDQEATWLEDTNDETIKQIYIEDFLEEGLLSIERIKNPDEKVVKDLRGECSKQRKQHRKFVESGEYKKRKIAGEKSHENCIHLARSHLFRGKRAELLAVLLYSRRIFQKYFDGAPSGPKLATLLDRAEGRDAVRRLVRRVKADRVGTAMLDITICGAVPPYTDILGGKLVSMLLVSPEVMLAYKEKYKKAPSIIASSMAGKPIVRNADLVLLCTTSLYAVGSSQYNRIKIPCEIAGGKESEVIRYEKLGHTMGISSMQLADDTVRALKTYSEQEMNGQQVHSIFGEGVNPRFRKARVGLDLLRLDSERLLKHGSRRIVYGIPLARNFRQYLKGIDRKADYFLDASRPFEATKGIIDWWIKRWLMGRIQKDGILDRVEQHTLVYPISHGARVRVPKDDNDQIELFDGL